MKDSENHPSPDTAHPHRSGFWSNLGGGALTFAILIHVVVLTVAAIWIYQVVRPPVKEDINIIGKPGGDGTQASAQPASMSSRMTPQSIPTSELQRIAAEQVQASLTLPEFGDRFSNKPAPASVTGSGVFGPSGEPGGGPGRGPGNDIFPGGKDTVKRSFIDLPPVVSGRCAKENRLQRLKANGGTAACEEAVVKGLRWLMANQNSDGSWGTSHQAAMTGLALLAYFGHCETPDSTEFGGSCARGITWLVDLGMKNNGRLGTDLAGQPFCYEHAIATYALAEALTFCKEIKCEVPNLPDVTTKAGQFIIDHQHKNGGWAYLYATDGGHVDVSVTGWQVQALAACSHTGIKFRAMGICINKSLDYLVTCQNESGGFGYVGPGDGQRDGYFTLTGVGMLCHQMCGKGRLATVRKGAKYVINNTKFDYNTEFADLYGHYYESQAMMQRGGEDWNKYNKLFRDQLLDNQDADGSWKVPGGGKTIRAAGAEYVANKVYRTCLCTLMLEVYYRFLNAAGGGAEERLGI